MHLSFPPSLDNSPKILSFAPHIKMSMMKNATVNDNEDNDEMPLREYMTVSGWRRWAERRMEQGEPSRAAPDGRATERGV
ncbi:hypothetical protein RIF29_10402 [Crotalaria pallida]|uniref:Uncharacterized protein n=1 Tax=Crotalaria pallida TaxID=3830 RepID=A0AAN9IJV4_CROPI